MQTLWSGQCLEGGQTLLVLTVKAWLPHDVPLLPRPLLHTHWLFGGRHWTRGGIGSRGGTCIHGSDRRRRGGTPGLALVLQLTWRVGVGD